MVRRRDLLALAGGLTSAWDVVYLGNVVGGALVVAIVVMIAPALDVAEPRAFAEIAGELTVHRWPVIIAVGVRAGWLTGLLSWLVAAVQRSVARFLYVWPIATASGFAHLHHSIAGTVEVLVGAFVSRDSPAPTSSGSPARPPSGTRSAGRCSSRF